ncbi:hypothetical protein ACFQZ2_24520, partial [Streptomonospora algeriensis]
AAEALRRAGFTDVDPRPHVEQWRAGSPGARLQAHHTHHLRRALITAGLTDAELSRVRDLLSHPDFCACSPVFYTIQGRRPPVPGRSAGQGNRSRFSGYSPLSESRE